MAARRNGRLECAGAQPWLRCAIAGLAILSLPGRAEAAPQQSPFAQAIERGRAVLRERVAAGEFVGVSVAVVARGRLEWSEGFGSADLEHRVPATAATLYGIGSLSKTLTMAAALTLVDDDVLALDAPVETWLRDFPHAGRGVTIRRIAAHQSGISDTFAVAHYYSAVHFPTIDSAYRGVVRAPLVSTPGSTLQYATGPYAIIARAMEVAAGQPYLDLMRTRVFEPAGLASIVPNDRRRVIPDRTGFYVRTDNGGIENAPYFDPSHKLPGAGFLATAADIARFGAALLRPGLLSESARAEMFHPVPLSDGTPTEYALGLSRAEFDGGALIHLPGGGPGISTWLFLHPGDDLVIALLSNLTTGPVGGRTHREIARAFLAVLRETPTGSPPPGA